MADTNIIGNLFGVSPDLLQTQQDQRAFNQGMQAGQNPLGGVLGNIGMFSSRAGAGLRGALGVESPEERINAMRQQASQQFDTASPQGLVQMAQFLNQQGDAQGAALAINRAQAIAKEAQAISTSRAQEQKALRETAPEVVRLQQTRDDLEARFGPNDRRVLELNRILEGKAKAGQTNINMPATSGKAFEAADPEALKEYRKESRAASGQLALIGQARQNLPSAVVGQGLPAIVRGLNTQLAPLGINVDQVASTRNLEQALKSIIAQGIKQYGANPSTVDLQFAEKAAADIQDPQKAIAATLEYLEKKARKAVDKQDAAEQWLLKKGNLAGFEKSWTEEQSPKAGKKTKTLSSGLVVEIED